MSALVDDAVAADHTDHFGPSLLAMTATLMALAGIRTGEDVLDVCCGPGALTLPAAAAAGATGRVLAVDVNPAMLQRGRRRSSPATDAAPITWAQGHDAELPLADAVVDKVVCGAKLQHVADARATVEEVRRVLRPGGRLAVSAWGSLPTDPVEEAALQAFARHGLRDACRRRTELSVDGSLVAGSDVPDLLVSAGLRVTHVTAGTITVPFVDAAAYARWRLASRGASAALADRPDAPQIRAEVLDAVTTAHVGGPVIVELPVHYAVSRLA